MQRLHKPVSLSELQQKEILNKNGNIYVEVVVEFDLIVSATPDCFLDLICEKISSEISSEIQDIQYTLVGVENGNAVIEVSAYVDMSEFEEEEEICNDCESPIDNCCQQCGQSLCRNKNCECSICECMEEDEDSETEEE